MQHKFPVPALLRAYLNILGRRPIRTLVIAWWWVTRRRVRARHRLSAALASLTNHYPIWLSLYQPGSVGAYTTDLPARNVTTEPMLAVHLHFGDPLGEAEIAALQSVLGQLTERDALYITSSAKLPGGFWTFLPQKRHIHILPEAIAGRAAAVRQVLNRTDAPYLVPVDPATVLTPGALETYARAASSDPTGTTIFYADQDERDRRGARCNPWLKPQWDEDLFLAQDYVSSACAIPADAARRVVDQVTGNDTLAIYDMIARLMLTDAPLTMRHLAYVTVTTAAGTWCRGNPARADLLHAVSMALARRQVLNPAFEPGKFGTIVVRWPVPDPPPKVSVIVPTRDRLDLLAPCVEGVLHGTDYPDIELVIADNASVEPETLAFFERCSVDPRVKIVRWPHPYNYAAINNFAVGQSSGPYLCLLNNDTEVIDPSWLREMMAHALRPKVGAVGARLLYSDRSVQHAGVVIGMGGAAGHAHRGLAQGEPGYFAQALVARGATAVTAACLVVARPRFDEVGGLDAEHFAIAYNDVDFCLKLRAAGWRNMYVPQAVLIHHEGKSRGLDFAPANLARYRRELAAFQERWGSVHFRDSLHHPALDRASETYRLKL